MDNPWIIEWTDIGVRLMLAFALGGLVGYERERTHSSAGFRTHILVCIGSTLVMLLSAYGFSDFASEYNVRMDPARLAAQVISGIGFLGAGVILRNGGSIIGLTTAASLWVVAAIGLAVGAGFYFGAVLTTAIVLFSLIVLSKAERRWIVDKKLHRLRIRAKADQFDGTSTVAWLEEKQIEVRKVTYKQGVLGRKPLGAEDDVIELKQETTLEISLRLKSASSLIEIAQAIGKHQGVIEVSVE